MAVTYAKEKANDIMGPPPTSHMRAREPEPPPGLAEFEQHVMAADAPAVVLIAALHAPAGAAV